MNPFRKKEEPEDGTVSIPAAQLLNPGGGGDGVPDGQRTEWTEKSPFDDDGNFVISAEKVRELLTGAVGPAATGGGAQKDTVHYFKSARRNEMEEVDVDEAFDSPDTPEEPSG